MKPQATGLTLRLGLTTAGTTDGLPLLLEVTIRTEAQVRIYLFLFFCLIYSRQSLARTPRTKRACLRGRCLAAQGI
ncbi:hypothetical protein GE09DRAFT_645937 [Coniochaeta sp. 2T2.1]|nr:hypothetical protein GE09DRAFT_645937 [Coniochaeta sp. 2T2.1]